MREPQEALQALIELIGTGVRADAAVVRFLEDEGRQLVARAVWAASPALSAELVGSRRAVGGSAPENGSVLRLPVSDDGRVLGELELHRLRRPFGAEESRLAES